MDPLVFEHRHDEKGQVAKDEESENSPAWLLTFLLVRRGDPLEGVDDKTRLREDVQKKHQATAQSHDTHNLLHSEWEVLAAGGAEVALKQAVHGGHHVKSLQDHDPGVAEHQKAFLRVEKLFAPHLQDAQPLEATHGDQRAQKGEEQKGVLEGVEKVRGPQLHVHV